MGSNVAKRKPKARPLAKRAKAPSVGQSAIAGLREGLAHLRGEQVPGLVVRKPVDVAAVRKGTGLSQDKFAAEFGLAVAAVRAAADRLGYSHRDLISGAGHDACWINRVAPTAMVMCPCVDGLSHNEAEEISKDWAMAGADVLLHAVVETAVIVE